MTKHWYFSLSPDLFSRHFITKKLLKNIFGTKKIKILDVGGKGSPLWAMIKNENLPYELTVIDILKPDKYDKNYNYIQADGNKMLFSDKSFEAVISSDVLEHIPDNYKEKFISESIRVAKDLVIISAPFQSDIGDFGEHLANNFYKKLSGKNHKWLSEHFKAKLPKKSFIENFLKSKKLKFEVINSTNMEDWLTTILPNLMSEIVSFDKKNLEEFNKYFNINFYELGDFSPDGYRNFYLIPKNSDLDLKITSVFENKKDFKKILRFREMIFSFFANEIINRNKTIKDLNNLVSVKQEEINSLSKTLNEVYNSKAYKLSQTLRRLKKLPTKK